MPRKAAIGAALAAMVAAASPGGAQPQGAAARDQLHALVEADAARIRDDAARIWRLAEPGFHETQSSALLQARLRKAGFRIDAGVAGMPTAFVASYSNGPGPVIAIMAEFDALPGVTQDSAAETPSPIPDAAAGHACGHNLLGAGAAGAAIALRAWMAANRISGEIRVYGAPAEENGDGKAYMVRAGLFDGVDAVLHWHPKDVSAVWMESTQANIKTDFTFTGVATHAAGSPEKGRSALAGVEVMDAAVNAMRQFVPDGTRIHGIIAEGGQAPNVVPARARSSYYVRFADIATLRELQERLVKTARGAAIATETEVAWEVKGGVYPLLINTTLARAAQPVLEQVAASHRWTPAEQSFAHGIQRSLKLPPAIDLSARPLNEAAPRTAGSTDVGDISHVVPTVGLFVAAWPTGTPAHGWAATGASGHAIGLKSAVVAAEALAVLGADLMLNPDVLTAARTELDDRRGADFRYEALLGDRPPPVDKR